MSTAFYLPSFSFILKLVSFKQEITRSKKINCIQFDSSQNHPNFWKISNKKKKKTHVHNEKRRSKKKYTYKYKSNELYGFYTDFLLLLLRIFFLFTLVLLLLLTHSLFCSYLKLTAFFYVQLYVLN